MQDCRQARIPKLVAQMVDCPDGQSRSARETSQCEPAWRSQLVDTLDEASGYGLLLSLYSVPGRARSPTPLFHQAESAQAMFKGASMDTVSFRGLCERAFTSQIRAVSSAHLRVGHPSAVEPRQPFAEQVAENVVNG